MTSDRTSAIDTPSLGGASLPEDLAEGQGAVRLLQAALAAGHDPSGEPALGCPDPALLTIYVYALARGIFGADELAGRIGEDGCLRYLAGTRRWEPDALRSFRRRQARNIEASLARLLARGPDEAGAGPASGRDPAWEARRRMAAAIRADSLALGE